MARPTTNSGGEPAPIVSPFIAVQAEARAHAQEGRHMAEAYLATLMQRANHLLEHIKSAPEGMGEASTEWIEKLEAVIKGA